MGQLDPTQPATRLTHDLIDPTQTRPAPPVLPCLGPTALKSCYQAHPGLKMITWSWM